VCVGFWAELKNKIHPKNEPHFLIFTDNIHLKSAVIFFNVFHSSLSSL